MYRYLYLCSLCRGAVIDRRDTLPLLCLCGGTVLMYRVPADMTFSDALLAASMGLPAVLPDVKMRYTMR